MRTLRLIAFAFLVLLCLNAPPIQAQDYPDTAPWNKASFRDVSIPLAQPSTGDYLLAIARAADANLLADATDFPEKQPPLSGEWKHFTSTSDGKTWKGKANELLLILLHERKLTLRQLPTETFLLWSEPDMASLGEQVAAVMPRVRIASPFQQLVVNPLIEERIRRAVATHLKETKWDGKSDITVSLAQLPLEVQNDIGALSRKLETLVPTAEQTQCWFRDDFWRSAVFHIVPPQAADPEHIQITGLANASSGNPSTWSRVLYFPASGAVGSGSVNSLEEVDLAEVELPVASAEKNKAEDAKIEAKPRLDLAVEENLRGKITLAANRKPLSEVLGEVSKQSGVQLSAVGDNAARLLVVRANGMTLAEWMERLSDLLGVRWEKTGDKTYLAQPPASPLEAQMIRMGDENFFHFWQIRSRFDAKDLPPNLRFETVPAAIRNIATNLDSTRLVQTKKLTLKKSVVNGRFTFGIPFTELSQDNQETVRRYVESEMASRLINDYSIYLKTRRDVAKGLVLRVRPARESTTRTSRDSHGRVSRPIEPAAIDIDTISDHKVKSLDFDNPMFALVPLATLQSSP